MKSSESKKWENLEKELKDVKDPKDMVRRVINTIENVLKTRNTTLKKEKNIKGLHSMYMHLTEAKSMQEKVEILAKAKEVGWNSGWNSNLREIFSKLYDVNYKNKGDQNDKQENYETTLEKVDKIKNLLDRNYQSKGKELDQQAVKIFEDGYKDNRVLGELSETEREKIKSQIDTLKKQIAVNNLKDQISSLEKQLGKQSSNKLEESLESINNQYKDLESKMFGNWDKTNIYKDILAIKDKIAAQAEIEKIANDFILKCRNVAECIHDHCSQKDEEALLNEYKKISGETKGWSDNIPACKEAEDRYTQLSEKIKKFRENAKEYIEWANEAVDVVHRKIENPEAEYKNPTNDGSWTLEQSLNAGIYACKIMGKDYDKSKTKFENALELNDTLDNLREIELASQNGGDGHFLTKYNEYQQSLGYLKSKNNQILKLRIKKVEDTEKYIILKREVKSKINDLPNQGEDFPNIEKYGTYLQTVKDLTGNINKLEEQQKNVWVKYPLSKKYKQKFEAYKTVVQQTGEVKKKLETIQNMKVKDLKSVCQKINAIDDLLKEIDEKKLMGNIGKTIADMRNDLVSKSQKNVDSLKQELMNQFSNMTQNVKNYKDNLARIQNEITTHKPLIEPNFLKDKIDEFSQNMSKMEAIAKEFDKFTSNIKNIKINNINDKDAQFVYGVADKLMDPKISQIWLYLLKHNNLWNQYVSLYDACLKKDLATLKGEQDTDKVKDGWVKLNQRINKAIMLRLQINWDKDYTGSLDLIRSSIVRSLENKISNLNKQQEPKKREEQYFEVAKELRSMYNNSSIGFRINDNIYSKFISVQVEIIQLKLKSKFDDIIKKIESSNPQCKDILIKNLEEYIVNYANVWTKEELEQTYKKMEEDYKTTLEANQYLEEADKKYWKTTNDTQAEKIYFEMAQKARDIWNKGLKISDKVFKTIRHGQDVMVRSILSFKEQEILKKYNNDPVIKISIYNNINSNNIFTKPEFEWASNQMDQNVKNTENMWNNQRSKYITELENGRNQLHSEDDQNIINDYINNLKNVSLSNIPTAYEQGLKELERLKNAQLPKNLMELKKELKEIKDEVREVYKFAKGKNHDEFKTQLLEKLRSGIKLCVEKDDSIYDNFKTTMLSWSKKNGLSIDETGKNDDYHNIIVDKVYEVNNKYNGNEKTMSEVTRNYLAFVSSMLKCASDYLKYENDTKPHTLNGSVTSQIKSLFSDLKQKSNGKHLSYGEKPYEIKNVLHLIESSYKIDMNNIEKYFISERNGGKSLGEQLLLIDALCLCSSVLYDDKNSNQKGVKEYKSQLGQILSGNKESHVTLLGDYLSKTRTEGYFGRKGMSLGWTVALMVKELLDDKSRYWIDKQCIAKVGHINHNDEQINNKKMWEVDDNGNPILSTHDIQQRHEGTCWFTAALLGLIEKNPKKILDCFPEREREVDKNGNIENNVKEITIQLYRVFVEGTIKSSYKNRARPLCPVTIKVPTFYMKFGSESSVLWANYLEKAMSIYRMEHCISSGRLALYHTIEPWEENYKGIWEATGGVADGIAYAAITGETAGAIEQTTGDKILTELKKKFNKNNRAAQVSFKEWKGDIMAGHAYAVSEITDDYIILLDPYDRKYKVTIEDFKKNVDSLKFGRVDKKNNQNN